MVGALSKAVFSTMRHIISLSNSCLIAKHAVALGNVMLGRLLVGIIVEDINPRIILPRNPNILVSVKMRGRS